MKIKNFFNANIADREKNNLKKSILAENIHRGKMLAIATTGFELIFIIADVSTLLLKVDNRFQFNKYLFMYSILIFINMSYVFFIKKLEKPDKITKLEQKKLEIALIVYITLIMSWGSVISLMDQKLYGQLIVFMVNMITCSVLFFLDGRMLLVPYLSSVSILIIGLPFFQNSKDILIGHYVNLFVFIFISGLASRIIYLSYCNDFINKVLLQKSNTMLEKEIEENRVINNKLAIANLQLRREALVDELTGIPNRRGFRNYIDNIFERYVKGNFTMAFILIDIDFFKNYNDNYGHEYGDKVLIAVAKEINSMVTNSMEFFTRWGGEEFLYVILNSNEEYTTKIAETIRQKVIDLEIPNEFSRINDNISVSIGTCTCRITENNDISRAVELADKALYSAKNGGRNCVKNINFAV